MRATPRARALLYATVGLGSTAVAVALVARTEIPLAMLALLAAAAILTEYVQIPNDESSPAPGDAHGFSFSTCIHVATILLVGPWTGALIAALGVVVADRLRGSAWRHVSFNASVFALAALSGGFVFLAAGGERGAFALPGDFAALAALAATYYVVNTALTCAMIALQAGTPFRPLAWGSFVDGGPSFTAEAGLGVALAFLAKTEPWALVVLGPLLFAVYQSHVRLAAIRRETTRALETFATVVDHRDASTFEHSARVAGYVHGLAQRLGLPLADVERLRWAGRLHDLGKIGVDASVLQATRKLDAEEWATVRRHPRLSAHLLRRFRLASAEARAVEYHHERFDGGGYYRVDADETPLAAHFLIVADSFDAMTSTRSYRGALSSEEALAEIEGNLGTQFHPVVGKAFVAWQRGEDPRDVLSRSELASLRRLWSSAGARRGIPTGLSLDPDAASVVAITATLVALATLGAVAGLATGAVAASVLVARKILGVRTRRLADALARSLGPARSRAEAVAGIGRELALAAPVAWVGLVSWQQRELAASVETAWSGGGQAPDEQELSGWLAREGDPGSALVVAPGPPGTHAYAALPLRSGDAVTGYLVVALDGPASRVVRSALEFVADRASGVLAAPADAAADPPRLLAAVR